VGESAQAGGFLQVSECRGYLIGTDGVVVVRAAAACRAVCCGGISESGIIGSAYMQKIIESAYPQRRLAVSRAALDEAKRGVGETAQAGGFLQVSGRVSEGGWRVGQVVWMRRVLDWH
jgi:hypothetical protein